MNTARICLLVCLLTPGVLPAERMDPAAVPEPLRPWIDWAVFDHPDRDCPFLNNNPGARRCAWPGRLRLDLESGGGRFNAAWEVFADSWIALPGNGETWPQSVQLDDHPGVIVERDGRPGLHLASGTHRVNGRFEWDEVPESLTIPADSGLVELHVNGRRVPRPEFDRNGRIWLRDLRSGRDGAADVDKNRVTLTVLRRIADENPLELFTRVEFEVTGEQREQVVGTPLPPGFIPVSITGTLPSRLETDGRLTVQLRPGRHVVTLRARHPEPLTELHNAAQPVPWPDRETWVFEARNKIRVVEIEGVQSVDPRQTRLPEEWRQLPAFAVAAGDVMHLIVTRRGDPEPEPDRLGLERELWLDFDGGGYTTRDRIAGRITRNWRLDSSAALHLGQVLINGEPQFITGRGDDDREGVEVRRGEVDLQADGRMHGPIADFAATGWSHDFQSVQATLRLPPGWDVLAISGVDNVPDTWLTRWTLLDLFMVLVISAAALRLWNWRSAAIALAATVLIWHAPEAPRTVWIHLIIAIALLRVLPQGKFRWLTSAYRNATALVLILICIPFVVQVLRVAVYPQLAQPPYYAKPAAPASVMTAPDADMAGDFEDEAPAEMRIADEIAPAAPTQPAAKTQREPVVATQGMIQSKAPDLYGIDPDAIVQTGPGLPNWNWREVDLRWNGPVDQSQGLSIHYMSPALNTTLNLARVAMLLAFLLVVSGSSPAAVLSMARRGGVSVLILVVGGLVLAPPTARAAGFPDPAMLEMLKRRLTAPPECAAQCADITRMRVRVSANGINIRLEVHAVEQTAIPLPGNARAWMPEDVLVDEVQTSGLSRDSAGQLWQQIGPGVHQIQLRGRLPQRSSVQIALPLRPRFTEVEVVDGWVVEGLRDQGRVEAQLQLTRVDGGAGAPQPDRFEKAALPPFVRVERTIGLGLDWTVTTRVLRVTGGDDAVVLKVPLLDGESVITPGIDVEDGMAQVNIPRNRNAISWQSALNKRETIVLTAPATSDWSETWRLRAGPIWHVGLEGIAPVHHQGEGDRWLPEWRPWAGEAVTIKVARPQGVSGQTVTVDSSTLLVKPGKRATETTLDMRLRSSKGGQYALKLPAGAELQEVRIGGVPQPVRAENDRLTVPITPGAQQLTVAWRNSDGVASRLTTPSIDLGIASINHEIRLMLGSDRWTLFTSGPRLGPAVLFWSLLAALLMTAWGLSRVPITPLKTRDWLLLVIGLSQLFIPLSAIVVLWLIALGLRERYGGRFDGWRFNLMQIALGALTVAAILVLVEAIRHGLLGHPDMHVAGNASSAHDLIWYADRVGPIPPTASVFTVPMFVYRILMLVWALWLALAIVRWLRWGWTCFASGGSWQAWREPRDVQDVPAPEGSA